MRFSIIIPVYNAQATLGRCLDSIVLQHFSDYELLLVNDGSTDGSDEICREYAEKYSQIQYLKKENGGVSSARNFALERAQGEYVLFVDSDDYVAEGYFQRIEHSLVKMEPDMLLFGYRSFGASTSERGTGDYYEHEEIKVAARVSEAVQRYLFSSLWSKVFRREIIARTDLRFDERIFIGEDQMFIFAYAMHIRSIASIPDTLYLVDVSDAGSLSRKRRDYLTEQLIAVNHGMAAALQNTEHSSETEQIYEKALAWVVYRSAYSCCKELLKYDLTAKQRRQRVGEICKLYRAENVKPMGWKCRVIALPVQLGLTWLIDFLISHKM